MKKLMESLELMLNHEDDASNEALHEYIVDVCRTLYEQYQSEELEEAELDFDDEETNEFGTDEDEIDAEEGVGDFGSEEDFGGEEEFGGDDFGGEDEFGGDDMEMGGDEEITKDDWVSLESKLDVLMAQMDELTGESHEEAHDEDFDLDGEIGDDDMDMDMDMGGEEEFAGADEDEFELEEDNTRLREYTEKVTAKNTHGEVGTGPGVTANNKSIAKPQGNMKASTAGPAMTSGGENKGQKPLNNQGGAKAKDQNAPNNKVKGKANSSQSKVTQDTKPTEGGEVGKGRKLPMSNKAQLQKKIK